MAIPSEGRAGASGRVVMRISSYTTEDERQQLLRAFRKSDQNGLALLRMMNKGYVNIEGQAGRRLHAALVKESHGERRLILVAEHVLSKLEKERGAKVE